MFSECILFCVLYVHTPLTLFLRISSQVEGYSSNLTDKTNAIYFVSNSQVRFKGTFKDLFSDHLLQLEYPLQFICKYKEGWG